MPFVTLPLLHFAYKSGPKAIYITPIERKKILY
jgi:hypothetical protein